MKAVMISIQPKWVGKIVSGEKTIEVRKTAPKLETSFKCYIYCTKARYEHEDFIVANAGTENATAFYGGGKVIGEFICDKIYNFIQFGAGIMFADENLNQLEPQLARDMTCLTDNEIENYLGNKDGYGLHISNLKIYDKPKEISEFNGYCKYQGMTKECWREDGEFCNYSYEYITLVHHIKCEKVLTRPPQSWCYVEE